MFVVNGKRRAINSAMIMFEDHHGLIERLDVVAKAEHRTRRDTIREALRHLLQNRKEAQRSAC